MGILKIVKEKILGITIFHSESNQNFWKFSCLDPSNWKSNCFLENFQWKIRVVLGITVASWVINIGMSFWIFLTGEGVIILVKHWKCTHFCCYFSEKGTYPCWILQPIQFNGLQLAKMKKCNPYIKFIG